MPDTTIHLIISVYKNKIYYEGPYWLTLPLVERTLLNRRRRQNIYGSRVWHPEQAVKEEGADT